MDLKAMTDADFTSFLAATEAVLADARAMGDPEVAVLESQYVECRVECRRRELEASLARARSWRAADWSPALTARESGLAVSAFEELRAFQGRPGFGKPGREVLALANQLHRGYHGVAAWAAYRFRGPRAGDLEGNPVFLAIRAASWAGFPDYYTGLVARAALALRFAEPLGGAALETSVAEIPPLVMALHLEGRAGLAGELEELAERFGLLPPEEDDDP